jgi:hemoglobin
VSASPPSLYEWAGGMPAFERLTRAFYPKVLQDDLLEPVFRGMDENHPHKVATWLAEVFGGPPQPDASPPLEAPVPRWGWGEAPPYAG